MADIITDGLQGPSGINEPLYAGMAERMRPESRPDDTGLVQIVRSPGRNCCLSDWHAWGRHMKEHLT